MPIIPRFDIREFRKQREKTLAQISLNKCLSIIFIAVALSITFNFNLYVKSFIIFIFIFNLQQYAKRTSNAFYIKLINIDHI
jgi:hypothetical protein